MLKFIQQNTIQIAIENTLRSKLETLVRSNESNNLNDSESFSYTKNDLANTFFIVDKNQSLSIDAIKNSSEMENLLDGVEIFELPLETVSLGPISLIDGLTTLKDIISEPEFFGILLIDEETKIRINPFHPLIASEISKSWDTYKDKIYTFYVYSGSWRNQDEESTEARDKFANDIVDILVLYNSQKKYTRKTRHKICSNKNNAIGLLTHSKLDEILEYYKLGYDFSYEKSSIILTEDNLELLSLVPHQLISNGVAFPYYGVSIMDSISEYGFHCSEMMSPNIGYRDFIESNNGLHSYNICTGGNGYEDYGIGAMNQANIRSPLNRYCLGPNWKDYVSVSLNISLEILSPFIPDQIIKKEKTRTDFGTRQEWLDHLSNTLLIKEGE